MLLSLCSWDKYIALCMNNNCFNYKHTAFLPQFGLQLTHVHVLLNSSTSFKLYFFQYFPYVYKPQILFCRWSLEFFSTMINVQTYLKHWSEPWELPRRERLLLMKVNYFCKEFMTMWKLLFSHHLQGLHQLPLLNFQQFCNRYYAMCPQCFIFRSFVQE